MCESCQAIFRYKIFIGRLRALRKSYARALRMSVSGAILLFSSVWVSKSHFTGLDSCHGEFDINIHKAGILCFATIDVLVASRSSHPEVSRENVSPQKTYK